MLSYLCINCSKSAAWSKAISNDSSYEPSFQWRRSEVSILPQLFTHTHFIIYPTMFRFTSHLYQAANLQFPGAFSQQLQRGQGIGHRHQAQRSRQLPYAQEAWRTRNQSFSRYSHSCCIWVCPKMGGTPKAFILVGFSLINHPVMSTPIYGDPPYLLGPFQKKDHLMKLQ